VLPILITFLVIMVGIAVVYFVGSQAPKKSTKPGKRGSVAGRRGATKSSASRSRPTKERSRFRETPGWLRKLPLVLVILAVVSLVIAVAQFRVAKSKATPTIALVIDASNSMDATDVQPNRLSAAESAAQAFLQQLPPDFAVSLVSFADEPKVLVAPTTDHTQVANALGDLPRGNGTVIGDGLASAMDEIQKYQEGSHAGPAAIVLLSDGNDTGSKTPPLDAATSASDRGIPVYTVILGTQKAGGGGANAGLLDQIATSTGAVSATAQTSSELSSVYEKLGSQLSSQLKISSSAQLFVIIAIALAAAAAVILLLTTQRRS
jgi:Ca-activated chloride channel family protein